jgi:ABC-type amino acid transport substrate-binding protein
MAKKPAKRYQSAGELAAAARRALEAPVRAAGSSGRHRTGRTPSTRAQVPWRAVVLTGVTVVLIAVVVVGLWQWRGAPWRSDVRSAGAASTATGRAAAPGYVEAIAGTVPADIKAKGVLVVGVNLPYAPNEFRDTEGKIVGFDVDLINAVGRTLGLTPEFRESGFDAIIPSVRAGDFNLGMSSFTDTKEREQNADFVTYFEAGTLWAQKTGSGVDPNNACGLRIGVVYQALQETDEIPHKSAACEAAGKSAIDKVVYVSQDDLTAALKAGKVDAMSADSPVTLFAIKNSGVALEPAGEAFDKAPYGWPVPKGSPLAESLRQAMVHLIQSGEYKTIATLWGVEKGMITNPVINGAVK